MALTIVGVVSKGFENADDHHDVRRGRSEDSLIVEIVEEILLLDSLAMKAAIAIALYALVAMGPSLSLIG